ncbi:NusG domain II-containing protein [uncultured Eubacterium sp.]|uniref:NusG domain II-containing protein n=1 Tax=uncultured Eubacterium sp. TaxID=165185 RepID=UPI0015AEDECE|nr:NusG domain II-containing protein [uncultured Eubacterium sp.]
MKKADLIIIVSVAVIVGVLSFFLYYVNSGSGNTVTVEKDGEIIQTLSLDEDFEKQYDFDGETNTLIIKDGKAMVTEANCPDGICANHKPISRAGESIICLPHKLVITVSNDKTEDNEIDAVA